MALLCSTLNLFAQTQPNDVASAAENFEESYYESLKFKALESYDKAIVSLEKCLELQPQNPVVFHELGRNYFLFKQYPSAEKYYSKAVEIDPKNKWYWIDLYEVYYQTKNYSKGIEILQKIIPLDKKYKEDLLQLYMYTQQFDQALLLVNELDETEGKTARHDSFRLEIKAQTKALMAQSPVSDLEKAVEKNPLNEENYLSLIEAYSSKNDEKKVVEIAQKLEKNIPNSDWAQVFLFKYYLDNTSSDQASLAMQKVFASSKIDKKIKYKMYNQFLVYTLKNPSFEKELDTYTQYFENDSEFDVYKEIGKFYYKKKNWELAIKNLEKAYLKKNTDFEINIFLLASYEETHSIDKMNSKANDLLDLFPNQPEYYFFAGKAAHLLKNLKKANDLLQSGLDYVIENKALEIDFLTELVQISNELGNANQANTYLARINKLKNN